MALQSPISGQCKDASLKGCDDLTEGTLLYIDGQPVEGRAKLQHAASENSPEQVRKFAAAVRSLVSLPGASSYSKELSAVADALETAPAGEAVKPTRDPEGEAHPESSAKMSPSVDTLRAGSSTPALDSRAYDCTLGEAGKPSSFPGTCLRVLVGPVIVTDIQSTGACPLPLFVFSGTPDRPRWFLLSGGGLNVHGASLLVRESESLIVGLRSGVGLQGKELECGITWAARRL